MYRDPSPQECVLGRVNVEESSEVNSTLSGDAFLDKIEEALEALDAQRHLNMFIHAVPEEIRTDAERRVPELSGHEGPLSGSLIAVKDNINVQGMPATCGSHILEGYHSPYDATVINRIRNAGGFIFGKTNLDEFAMGSSNEYSYYGPVRNPVNPEYVPGGSSGGSAAAVRTGVVDMALGSETGGSVRQPAAFCGVVGLKPTYGRVSRYGLVAFASSFDQIAPFGRRVSDVARLLGVIAGRDERDSTSIDTEVPEYLTDPVDTVDNWKIGIPVQYFAEGLDPEIEDRIRAAADWLQGQGAEVVEVDLPHTEYAIATYYILTTAEASSNLARYDGMRYGYREDVPDLEETYRGTRSNGFGPEVKRRIMLGTYVLSAGYYEAYYSKAQKVRRLIKEDYDTVFEDVDVLISPTTPTTAFPLESKTAEPLQMYLSDIYTVSANLTGIPAISIPAGHSSEGLPIGLQIMAPHFEEETIFRLAEYIERNWQPDGE